METTIDFTQRVTAHYLGVNLEDVQDVYIAYEEADGQQLLQLEDKVGIDPMLIMALIELLSTVIPLVIEWCNAPEKLVRQSRIRNALALRVFRIRVYSALRTAVSLEDTEGTLTVTPAFSRKITDSILDVAHNNGEEYIQAVVNEYKSL